MSKDLPSTGSGPKIFVSYRRSDCPGHAGRLYDLLCERFGERQVFMDIDAIRPGEDFTKALTDAVNSSSVFLAIIGKHWLRDAGGVTSKLHDPDDFVRFEIAAALKAGKLIIPVLMEKASMPHAEDLPAELADFSKRNAIDISDLRFRYDVKRLIEVLESVMPKASSAGARIGPYTLVSKLGRGAFGVVWLAEKRTALATTKVALKTPNEEDVDLEAVKSEAEVWVAATGHPNIHPIIDADIYDGRMVIVSEYAPDGSLNRWLEANGGRAPSLEAAVRMTDGILAGLEHLHGRNILHRDLKPDNILLQGDNPRLADFGIAKMLKDVKSKTQTGGSPWYLAPEAFEGRRSVQTDLWAVGVLLYQFVAGSLPYPQDDPASVMHAILTRPPEPLPPSVPVPLRDVIAEALEKQPESRFGSAAEMRWAVNAATRSIPNADEIATLALPRGAQTRTVSDTSRHTSTAPVAQSAIELRTRQATSVRLVLSEIPKYFSNFIGVLSSPKAFVRRRHHEVDQPLLRAMTFWVISAVAAILLISTVLPAGWASLKYLGRQGLVGVVFLVGYVGAIRLAWKCVGGKAPFLSLLIPFAYLQGVANVFGNVAKLLSVGIAKAFSPTLAQIFINQMLLAKDDSEADAYLQKAVASFQSGNRSPLVIYLIVYGLPILAFFLSFVWLFIGWGAFRELNAVSKYRSIWAWTIWMVVVCFAIPLLALIGLAALSD